MGPKLLIIDDDIDLLHSLHSNLTSMGYEVITESNGEAGLQKAVADTYDVIISDVVMPGRSGLEICRELRSNRNCVPILFLSGQDDIVDRVVGLEVGADDYLIKPFHIRELTARVDALLRRVERIQLAVSQTDDQLVLVRGELVIDRPRMKVTQKNELLSLTATEYRLLEALALRPGKVLSRDDLNELVWGYATSSYDHTITTTMNRLRSKLEPNPRQPLYIKAVRGVGYRFAAPEELDEEQGKVS